MIKKNIALLSVIIAGFSTIAIAQVWFEVIPETESSASAVGAVVDNIREWWSVWKKYKDTAYWPEKYSRLKKSSCMMKFKDRRTVATGVMTGILFWTMLYIL